VSTTTLPADARLISYLTLRKFIGLIGILLPFALVIINMLLVRKVIMQGSMSGYYYTDVRGVLVGSLCAIGVFLFAYRGYGGWDDALTDAAGLFAIGVALFPTAPANPSPEARNIGYVHLTCAGLLFAVLAVIALWQFTKTEPGTERTAQKRKRDLVYRICGIVIAVCLVLVPIESLVIGAPIQRFRPLFWLEAAAVVAFGVAWLVKGQAILKDDDSSGGNGGPPDDGNGEAATPPGSGRVDELTGSRR
jgi:uncharacterized membrane protein